MASSFVRGSNPIWFEVDLDANAFTDEFFLYVLQNDLPYLPAVVYHDPDGNVPWTQPIQFLANGTLPIDIYFDPDVVYRLEFRKNDGIDPPSQQDALIYLVENYTPTGGSVTPSGDTSVVTDNQMTNPQFPLINFVSPTTFSSVTDPDPIDVAPGWTLNLTGTGTATLERVALNDSASTINPTNAPYALRITLSGTFTGAYLAQRFQQNGNLWATDAAPRYVASSITTRLQGANNDISAVLVNSEGETLTTVLASTTITEEWNEYLDYGLMPAPADSNVPPASYLEYRLILPTSVDIYVTSFQLIAEDLPLRIAYNQDSIQRQIDYTFHYYKDQLAQKPIPSYTLGWDFAFNPCQALGPTVTPINTGANGSAYIADQTIVFQTVNSAIGATVNNTGIVLSTASDTSFALIQYLDAKTAVELLNQKNAFQLRGKVSTGSGTVVGNVNLYWTQNVSVPTITSPDFDSLVTGISGSTTSVVSGWVPVARSGFAQAQFTMTTADQTFSFNGWDARAVADINSATFFAVVITFQNMLTTQQLTLKYGSLVGGDIATPPAPLNALQTLKALQYYYQMSYVPGTVPGTVTTLGSISTPFIGMNPGGPGGTSAYIQTFTTQYEYKRAIPTVTYYAESSGAINNVTGTVYVAGVVAGNGNAATSGFTQYASQTSNLMVSNSATTIVNVGGTNVPFYAVGTYQYTADARFGVV